jgi:hypothetical protein
MCKLALIVALLGALIVPSVAAPRVPPREQALVECLIGKAAVSLLNRLEGQKVNASAATDAAYNYAFKGCKGGRLSEAGGDFVHNAISAMATHWLRD